jgi:hypothetical protein
MSRHGRRKTLLQHLTPDHPSYLPETFRPSKQAYSWVVVFVEGRFNIQRFNVVWVVVVFGAVVVVVVVVFAVVVAVVVEDLGFILIIVLVCLCLLLF